jgi:hypothetical protein
VQFGEYRPLGWSCHVFRAVQDVDVAPGVHAAERSKNQGGMRTGVVQRGIRDSPPPAATAAAVSSY